MLHAQQPGTLDPSFGDNGTLTQKPPVISQGVKVVKVTKEGRILIGTSGPYRKFALTFQIDALLPDGSPDLSFGDNGSAHAAFLADLNSLALLPDGRILAAGTGRGNLLFDRFKTDGTLDSTFGINGIDSESIGYDDGGAGSLTIQPDGKFLVGGSVTTNTKQNISQLYTARFLPNGTKDLSYGNEGVLLSKSTGTVTSVALQKDGKIIAGGFSGILNYDALFHIERYNEDGSYDKSFGNNGIVETEVLKSCDISSIALQGDGKLVVTGQSNSESSPVLTVARYNSDGNLDNGFGTEGIVTTSFPQYNNGEGKKVFVLSDKIVVAGTNFSKLVTTYANFALVAYNLDGTLDPQFGEGGIQTTNLEDFVYATTADVQPDGKIVIIGNSYVEVPFTVNRALARYYSYPVKVSLIVRIKRFLHNHGIIWNGLPAEDKIAYYSVEQSSNSRTGFLPIAKVSGRSNLRDYSITNSSLLQGTNYYRIKAISTDGVVRYSEVVSADNITNTVSVYPNPAKNYVAIQGLPNNETANLSLFDANGNVKMKGISNGAAQYRFQIDSLYPGAYHINIATAIKTEVLKFVKE